MDEEPRSTLTRERDTARATVGGSARADAVWLFGLLWAASVLFHVLGNPRYAWGPWQVVLGLAVCAVVLRPASLAAGSALAVAVFVSIWSEAPLLGNHWLFSGLIGAVWIASSLAAAPWRPGDRAGRMAADLLPAVRLTTLAFYGWAAFNKLNSGFVRPATSCASFYISESARSNGLGSLGIGEGWTGWVAIGATIACEGSVFTLLLLRRTRPLGVALGLLFHFTLALDRSHQFVDFSSILLACFTAFLPPTFASAVRRRIGRVSARRPSAALLARTAVLAFVLVGCLAASTTVDRPDLARRLRLLTVDTWLVLGGAATVVVVAWVVRRRAWRSVGERVRLRPRSAWILVLPALAFLNGLTPYVDLKTANGWNMYANLTTGDGRSNHWVLRRAPALGGADAEPLTIVSTDDPALRWYATNGYLLPRRTLRAYLSRHPDVQITYASGSGVHSLRHASDEPALVRPVPVLVEKFVAYRAVDADRDGPRCQDVWGPAL